MENDNASSRGHDYSIFIEALSWEAAIKILLDLCNDGVIAERISAMAKAALAEVDADVVADEVFRSL